MIIGGYSPDKWENYGFFGGILKEVQNGKTFLFYFSNDKLKVLN